jgi:hypothetical protein
MQRFIHRLWYRKKITPDQFVKLYLVQGKKCAICKKPPARGGKTKFNFDHDHGSSSLLRGLLCIPYNREVDRYEKLGLLFRAYMDNPPAKQAELNIRIEDDYHPKFVPPSKETLSRLQDKLDHGTRLKELLDAEPSMAKETLKSFVPRGLLHLSGDTVEQIRTLDAVGTPHPQIAKAVGVYPSTVKWIVSSLR